MWKRSFRSRLHPPLTSLWAHLSLILTEPHLHSFWDHLNLILPCIHCCAIHCCDIHCCDIHCCDSHCRDINFCHIHCCGIQRSVTRKYRLLNFLWQCQPPACGRRAQHDQRYNITLILVASPVCEALQLSPCTKSEMTTVSQNEIFEAFQNIVPSSPNTVLATKNDLSFRPTPANALARCTKYCACHADTKVPNALHLPHKMRFWPHTGETAPPQERSPRHRVVPNFLQKLKIAELLCCKVTKKGEHGCDHHGSTPGLNTYCKNPSCEHTIWGITISLQYMGPTESRAFRGFPGYFLPVVEDIDES